MQSVTIGTSSAYLRLAAAPRRTAAARLTAGPLLTAAPRVTGTPRLAGAPRLGEHLPRGFLKATLHTEELTATRVLDLRRDYAGLIQFFANAADQLDGPTVWGARTELELAVQRVHGREPHYLVLSITLRNRGWQQRAWTLETALTVTPDELHQAANTLKSLTD